MQDKILEKAIADVENEINELKEKNPYNLPNELIEIGYIEEDDGINVPFPLNKDYSLKLSRKDEKTFTYAWNKKTEEGKYKPISTIVTSKKSIIEENETRTKKLIQQATRREISKDKKNIEGFLDKIAVRMQNTDKLEILKDGNFYVETTDQQKENEIEDTKSSNPTSFEDYPPHIQQLAKEILVNDDLLDRICDTTAYRVGANTTEIRLMSCGMCGLYVGGGNNILAGGKTGVGKTKIILEVLKNFPDCDIYYLNTSPKYIFRDAENLQGYKIIVANDIPLTLANIELIKSLTREEDVISYKTLEGDKNGKQTRLELELTGKYIVIMTFAKNTPDEELANPFFNLNIAPNDKEKKEIREKIKEQNNIDTLHHKGYNLANEVNKCAIQYLIDKDFTVFNPYSIFFNPNSFNNRDINNVLNFVKGKTFFKYNKRRTITFKGRQICFGSFDDLYDILEIWEDTEEVQKYKLDSIQEEILKILPTLSEDDATKEANKYEDDDFTSFNRNAKKRTIETDIANGNTDALPLKDIMEKTSRGDLTVKRALYYEDKNSNKPTLYSMGLVDYYEADIGSKYPQRMFFRKQKSSNPSKRNDYMVQKEIESYVGGLEEKKQVLISLMIWFNILVNMYIEKKISSYCENDNHDISSYDGMCDFIQGFITEYENELQVFDSEHISLSDLDYHNGIFKEKNSLDNFDKFLNHMLKITEDARNSNQDTDISFKSEMNHIISQKSKNGAISENAPNTKTTENTQNSNQDRNIWFKSENNIDNNTENEIQSFLEEKKITDKMAGEVIHLLGTSELTLYEIERKLSLSHNVGEIDNKTKLHLEQLMNKLVKANIVEEKFTTGTVFNLSKETLSALNIDNGVN